MEVIDLVRELGGFVNEDKIYLPPYKIGGIPMCNNIYMLVRIIYEKGMRDGRERYIDRMIDLFKDIK